MRVMTFSRTFPKYHPKAGQPTHFVEKIWGSLCEMGLLFRIAEYEGRYNDVFPCQYTEDERVNAHSPKYHTVRAGHRWKVGDFFSPRVWSGVPYRSTQIVFGPDIMVEKIWDFGLREDGEMILDNHEFGMFISTNPDVDKIAKNDGLLPADLVHWFALKKGKAFDGQIICWNKNIEY